MEEILQRIWDLANLEGIPDGSSRKEIITESQALWRTIETLLGTCKPSDFVIGDARFKRTLACLRTVLVHPEDWRMSSEADRGGDIEEDVVEKGVYIFSIRILNKIACRGERERDNIVREGFVELLVQSMHSDQGIEHYQSSITCCASVLQLFQTLAFDARNRHLLDLAETVPLTLYLMQMHPRENMIQLLACKFLQFMAYEEQSKQHIVEFEGLRIILDALRQFPQDTQLVVSASDLIYFLSMELENSATGTGSKIVHEILEMMTSVMQLHANHEQIQTHGISILNSFLFDPNARGFVCSTKEKNILEIVCNVLNVHEEEAINDAIDLLVQVLTDEDTYETLFLHLTHHLMDTSMSYVDSYKRKLLDTIQILSQRISAQKNMTEKVEEVVLIEEKLRTFYFQVETFESTGTAVSSKAKEGQEEKRVEEMTPPPPCTATTSNSSHFVSSHVSEGEGEETDTERAIDSEVEDVLTDEETKASTQEDEDDEKEKEMPRAIPSRHYVEHNESLTSNRELLEETPATSLSVTSSFFQRLLGSSDVPSATSTCTINSSKDTTVLSSNSSIVMASAHVLAIENAAQIKATQAATTAATTAASSTTTTLQVTAKASCEKWRQRYESIVLELSHLKKEHHLLNENYKMTQRRCQEQSKLLNLQNARLKTHMEVHTQVLERMQKLENSLNEMTRKHQVERELRLAEVIQSEKISFSLNEAMKEIKALNTQHDSTTKDILKQKETQNQETKEMMETKVSTFKKQTFLVENLLQETKQESMENLLMREEDLNVLLVVPKHDQTRRTLWNHIAGHVLKKNASSSSSSSSPSKAVIKKRSQSIVISQALATNDMVASLRRPTSPHNGPFPSSFNGANDLEYLIDSTLRQVFETLDTSMDEHGQTGVHLTVVRRFFQDIGLVQPPLMEGDLDTLLAKVLMAGGGTSHHGRRRRSSSTSSTASMVLESTKRHSRSFDPETFNEAVITVGMRRFPRLEMRQMLQVMMSQYLRPYSSSRKPHPSSIPVRSASVIYTPSSSFSSSSSSSTSIYRPSRAGSISSSNGGCSSMVPTALTSSSVLCMNAIRSILHSLHELQQQQQQQQQDGGNFSDDFSMNRSSGFSSNKKEVDIASLLEMHGILSREQKPLSTLCEFYTQNHSASNSGGATITPTLPSAESTRDEIILGMPFDTILAFALDFELIPAFMDRLTLKRIYSAVTTLMKKYVTQYKKLPYVNDVDTLKKVSFSLLIARISLEIFSTKREYDTPEKQITGLLQWMDTCAGRDKVTKKSLLPMVIRFTTKLYTLKINS